MQVPEKQEQAKDWRGVQLRASARLFQEFDLLYGEELLMRLKYAFNAKTEEQGGFTIQCDYQGEQWTLEFFRVGLLQLESYRLLRGGRLIVLSLGDGRFYLQSSPLRMELRLPVFVVSIEHRSVIQGISVLQVLEFVGQAHS